MTPKTKIPAIDQPDDGLADGLPDFMQDPDALIPDIGEDSAPEEDDLDGPEEDGC